LLQKEAQSKMAAEEEVNRLKHQLNEFKKVEVYPENLAFILLVLVCLWIIHFQLCNYLGIREF